MIWNNFKGTKWKESIDVRDFIMNNYTPYNGGEDFLCGPTKRTKAVFKKVQELFKAEQEKGGVLDIDVNTVASLLTFKPGYVDKNKELIVGLQTDKPLKRAVNPFGGLRTCEIACQQYGYELNPELKNYFKYKTTHNDGVFRAYTKEMRDARSTGVLTGLPDAYGRGRLIGDYRRIALYGMDYLIEQKKKDKQQLDAGHMAHRVVQLVEDVQKQIIFMENLKTMAAQYGYDIGRPAQNAREAVQWLYFGFLGSIKEQNGAANSIGRITAFLDIYMEHDIQNGTLTEEGAQELMDDFVIKLRMVRHLRTAEYNELFAGDPVWVTMSEAGVTLDGRHMVTKNAFRVLNTLYNLEPNCEPNITILWSKNLPEKYKEFCAKVSIETDSIQYENDDVMRKSYGDDYAISCCVSAIKMGKQMQFFGARCNLPKVLLMALNGGRDELEGKQIGPKEESFAEGQLNYKNVFKAYKRYSKWMAHLYVNTMNLIHYMHDKYAYERLTMAMHDTKLERLMAFGVSGLSVLVDSLCAIKYAKVTAIKNEQGLISDFKVEGDYPKYGNNDNRADKLAQKILEDFYKNLKQTPTYRGSKHTLSVLTITSNVVYGKKTGSTPDGRKLGEPFAPGANPMHGRDKSGALASLNSVAKLKFDTCRDGISNTFSVVPDILGKKLEEQKKNLVTLLNGYFKKGAHHLNVNVLNKEKLVEAMNNPSAYPNLTIRVSGYAVNFHKLTKCQQEEVLARTFHSAM